MNRFFFSAAAVVAVLFVACGGKQSMAGKSAAAYRDAVAKGVDVGAGGASHGGHTANADGPSTGTAGHDAMAGMDHGSMSGMDHGQMKKGSMPGMGKMAGMDHGSMSGMDHGQMKKGSMPGMGKMEGMSHGSMSGMDHGQMKHGSMPGMANMPGMSHGSMGGMAGMQHGEGKIPAGGLWGPQPGSLAVTGQPHTQSTLQPDTLDAAAPVSVGEARKSAADDMSGMSHDSAPAPATKSPPPKPEKQQAIYTCPMHPEVTSSSPGTCPKCGMLLVRKGTR